MSCVIDFSTPIEGRDLKRVEAELASRTLAGVVLNRYEVGQMAAVGSCSDCERATHEAVPNSPHRIMWCYRPADGGIEDVACLIEVPAEKVGNEKHATEDRFWRMVLPICALHQDDRNRIALYAFRNRHGSIVGLRIPKPKRRKQVTPQPQREATA